ncbi:unnamed protein product [Rotaria sp. Silwood2]|nr:unnamed protein product [Rotaria sp. Silwood2]CAF3008010.1 unnamed protein product [Rotaria sp. Silwood2]
MALGERFCDVDEELLRKSSPLLDYRNQPLMTLEGTIQRLSMSQQNYDDMVKIAKRKVLDSIHNLTIDEAAAIYLYTMRHWKSGRDFSSYLNTALRVRLRHMITPWFLYLQLLITALNKLPSMKGTVWRYAIGDITDKYQNNCIWSGFSSCTGTVPEFERNLNKYDECTVFKIECINGKAIRNFSNRPWENEVLLLPDTRLRVISKGKLNNILKIVHLQEEGSPHLQLARPLDFKLVTDETNIESCDLMSTTLRRDRYKTFVQSYSKSVLRLINLFLMIPLMS